MAGVTRLGRGGAGGLAVGAGAWLDLPMMRWWTMWLLMAGLVASTARGQDVVAPEELPADSVAERGLVTLEALVSSLADAVAERDRLAREANDPETNEDRRREVEILLEMERQRIDQMRRRFQDIVGGVEAGSFIEVEEPETDLQQQAAEFIEPLLAALREPTRRLREMEDMRKMREFWRERRDMSQRVLNRIREFEVANMEGSGNERLAQELRAVRRQWELRHSEAVSEYDGLTLQIEERELTTPSFWQSVTGMIGDFVKSRGLNLLIALVAAVLGFVLTRRIYAGVSHIGQVYRGEDRTLLGRASDLIALSAAIFVAIACVLVVFFARGDWLLLTLAVILLLGALWAGKTALPPYVEQIRMLLNLGAVREGERVVQGGLPWRVRSLGFYTVFENPDLQGGLLRIPLREVMAMISRQVAPDEPWFPCNAGDWVILGDDVHGRILSQTPDQVVLERRGGSIKTYQTTEFLELAPESLAPGFRVREIFGIDYAHQSICTTEVPKVFRDAVEAAMVAEFGAENVRQVLVDFQAAGASSLDFAIKVDLTHAAAPRYRYIPRLIQSTCVDVCNERGWVIPFTQVTLHQGAGGG